MKGCAQDDPMRKSTRDESVSPTGLPCRCGRLREALQACQ